LGKKSTNLIALPSQAIFASLTPMGNIFCSYVMA
jgi:hypothetical protein